MGMREKLIKILRVPIFPHELADPTEAVADYLLDNDVVPVVRCKDCRHWIERDAYCSTGTIHVCWFTEALTGNNGFCYRGERKDNETV